MDLNVLLVWKILTLFPVLTIFFLNNQAPIQDPNFLGFCYEDELFPGDFDADGRSDIVCRMTGGSQYQIALSGL